MLQFKIACSLFAKMKSEIKMIAFKAELTLLFFTFRTEANGTNYDSCITQASKTSPCNLFHEIFIRQTWHRVVMDSCLSYKCRFYFKREH